MRDWKKLSGLSVAEECGRARKVDLATRPEEESPELVWLGHGSFLLHWHGLVLVLDPVFRKWIGATPRLVPVPDFSLLGKVDLALISHGHMDHLDSGSLRATGVKRIFLPAKTERFLAKDMGALAEPLAMGQRVGFGRLSIMVVEAKHGGWRYPWQKGFFACGFLVSNGQRAVYLAGDTAYGNHFSEIARMEKIDTAVLPIGAYAPRWFLKSRHMNPEEACQAAIDLGARQVVPGHFGSYRLSLEGMEEPMTRFVAEAERRGIEWGLPFGIG